MSEFTYTTYLESGDLCLMLDCTLEYEPGGGDGWNEPRYESTVTLCTAKIGDIDIYPSLTKDEVEEIEQAAAVELSENGRQADEDRAAERDFERRSGAYL
jgi:hypothetical protein